MKGCLQDGNQGDAVYGQFLGIETDKTRGSSTMENRAAELPRLTRLLPPRASSAIFCFVSRTSFPLT
jgi:hypothetical protein